MRNYVRCGHEIITFLENDPLDPTAGADAVARLRSMRIKTRTGLLPPVLIWSPSPDVHAEGIIGCDYEYAHGLSDDRSEPDASKAQAFSMEMQRRRRETLS